MAAYWVCVEKCGRSFTEGGNERAVEGQIRVVLILVLLGSFTVKKKNVFRKGKEKNEREKEGKEQRRQASPATSDGEDNLMTKLRQTTHNIQQDLLMASLVW